MNWFLVFYLLITAKITWELQGVISNTSNIVLKACGEIRSLDVVVWESPIAESQENNASFILKLNPALFDEQNCSLMYYYYYLSYCKENRKTDRESCGNLTLQENHNGTDITVLKSVLDWTDDPLDRDIEEIKFALVNKENGQKVWESCHVMSKSEDDNSFVFHGTGAPYATIDINETTSTAVKLHLKLPNCEDRPYFLNTYLIVYQIAGSKDSHNITIPIKGHFTEFSLPNLMPFTNYSIKVAAITTDNKTGSLSKEILIKTAEACPQISPIILSGNITNQSFELELVLPVLLNGKLIRVEVHYLEPLEKVLALPIEDQNLTHKRLIIDDLKPYTNYCVAVRLCTRTCCSPESKPLIIQTDIGISGAPKNFRAYELSDKTFLGELQWESPHIGGPNYTWEIFVKQGNNNDSEVFEFGDLMEKDGIVTTYIPYLKCEGNSLVRYEFKVRVLVLGENGRIFQSDFSDPGIITGCKNSYAIYYAVIALALFAAIFGGSLIRRRIRKLIKKYVPKIRVPLEINYEDRLSEIPELHKQQNTNAHQLINKEFDKKIPNDKINGQLLNINHKLPDEITVIGPTHMVPIYVQHPSIDMNAKNPYENLKPVTSLDISGPDNDDDYDEEDEEEKEDGNENRDNLSEMPPRNGTCYLKKEQISGYIQVGQTSEPFHYIKACPNFGLRYT